MNHVLEQIKKFRKAKDNPQQAFLEMMVQLRKENQQELTAFKTDLRREMEEKIKNVLQSAPTQKIIERIVDRNTADDMFKAMDTLKDNIKGDTGGTGIQGKLGEKGDTGETGIPGEKGDTGIPGKDGENGEDASAISPTLIVTKLEALEGEKRLDKSAIKGLENILDTFSQNISRVRNSIGKGGGGMSNIIHDEFDGDGSTTVFTLSSRVAGNGTAVFGLRYQGSTQQLGSQYTISGRTLTMTFTPDNGTKIHITYART